MEAHAKEIERLRLELERTSLKKEEGIPELTVGALEGFKQEERVTQWMHLCVDALKKWVDKMEVGEQLRRPVDHAGSNQAWGRPPKDHILAYRVWEVLCKSHTAYMARYTTRAALEPKGRSPYASLDEARGALGKQLTARTSTSGKWEEC